MTEPWEGSRRPSGTCGQELARADRRFEGSRNMWVDPRMDTRLENTKTRGKMAKRQKTKKEKRESPPSLLNSERRGKSEKKGKETCNAMQKKTCNPTQNDAT